MGIQEVWRHNGQQLQMFGLRSGQYVETDCSQSIPGLTSNMINSILKQRFDIGETALIRQFRHAIQG
jgi:hypothetical protein